MTTRLKSQQFRWAALANRDEHLWDAHREQRQSCFKQATEHKLQMTSQYSMVLVFV